MSQTEILQLSQELQQANQLYYQGQSTGLSDQEFDFKLKRLQSLELEYPQFKLPSSPTERVGSDLESHFAKHQHEFPMLSISNTYNFDELLQFIEDTQSPHSEFVVEQKIDGCSLSLIYQDGKLVQGVTRGDGSQGDTVTENIRTILDIPLSLNSKSQDLTGRLEVRGEVYMSRQDFNHLNERLVAVGDKPMQNPRNTAAGTLKMKNSKEVAKRRLRFFAFSIPHETHCQYHSENLQWLQELGFKIAPHLCTKDFEEIKTFINQNDIARDDSAYDIDGMVIKTNSIQKQQSLGNTSKSPRWLVSYKFLAEKALSQLLSIQYQVGRTGAVTPVANLSPVSLAGTTVKRASLHNFDEIHRLGVQILDYVWVEKGGEIIPKVTGVELEKRPDDSQKIFPITECPECESRLVKLEEEVVLRCVNPLCPAQVQRALEHFVSREAMNIDSLGPALIAQLIEHFQVRKPSDLYKIKTSHLIKLERMGEKSAKNTIKALEASKSNATSQLIHGLGIRHVGRNASKIFATAVENIWDLKDLTINELEELPEIGSKIAESVYEFFHDEIALEELRALELAGLNFVNLTSSSDESSMSQPLEGQTIVITGTLPSLGRSEARKMAEDAGAKVSGSVSAKTHILLAGEKAGSKLTKAEALGIRVISEETFLEMIKI